MDKARIFLAENDRGLRQEAATRLKQVGHVVVCAAPDMSAANNFISNFLVSEGVTLAILDANLTIEDASGEDGKRLAERIRELRPNLPIICWTKRQGGYSWGEWAAKHIQSLLDAVTLA